MHSDKQHCADQPHLPAPLRYIPLAHKPFAFTPGLRTLRVGPGRSDPDERLIQLDHHWAAYRQEKMQARHEQFDKYVCAQRLSAPASRRVTALLLDYLDQMWPHYFRRSQQGHYLRLHCVLSGETLHFSRDLELIHYETASTVSLDPAYHNALDALCCQIQEDLAICETSQGQDYISWLHVCLPNHWAAADIIGQDFVSAHARVPGMDRLNRQAAGLVATLIRQGPFERFAWGLATDTELNRHPAAPRGVTDDGSANDRRGRHFDADCPQLYLRVERQVTFGLPDIDAFIFLIRTYLYDVTTLDDEQLKNLGYAIDTMPPAIRAYKGLAQQASAICAWLKTVRH